jgi:small subunit ribosomal protein S20
MSHMPIIKQAIKKLASDKKRQQRNDRVRKNIQSLLKKARKKPTQKAVTSVFSALDKASKRNIIHPNKAARLKSRLSKLLQKK